MRTFLKIALNAVALLVAAHLVPGIEYQPEGLLYLLLAGLVMGVVNLFVKPLVVLLSLPLIVLTLGVFYLAVNGLMLQLVALILPELSIAGCLPAILGGIVIGLFNWVMQALLLDKKAAK